MRNGVDQQSSTSGTDQPAQNEQPLGTTRPSNPPEWHPDEKNHRQQERRYWGAIIALTFLAAAGAIASAAFAYRAANAAWNQVDIAKDNEQRQLRAYLHIDHGMINARENTASVVIDIRHAGTTPAYKIRLDAYMTTARYIR